MESIAVKETSKVLLVRHAPSGDGSAHSFFGRCIFGECEFLFPIQPSIIEIDAHHSASCMGGHTYRRHRRLLLSLAWRDRGCTFRHVYDLSNRPGCPSSSVPTAHDAYSGVGARIVPISATLGKNMSIYVFSTASDSILLAGRGRRMSDSSF